MTKPTKDELDMIKSGLYLLKDSAKRQTNNAANNEKLKAYHQDVVISVESLINRLSNLELPL